jgi:hypothetical protein
MQRPLRAGFFVSHSATNRAMARSSAQGENENMTVHDMEKAQATYSGFMATLKWAIPVIAVIVLAVVAAIAS